MKHAHPTSLGLALTAFLALGSIVPVPRLAADDLGYHEPSARAASLGGAFTARADDTSALFYNPAGLAFLGSLRIKTNITLGGRALTAAWPSGGPSFRSNPNEILGGHALSWQPIRRVTVATGLFPVATFGSNWNQAWSGRAVSTRSELYAYSFRSALAVEVVKDFAVSAGLDVMSMRVLWHRQIAFDVPNYPLAEPYNVESRETLGGHGVGFVAGAMWKIVPAVQIGASYRSAVAIDLAGTDIFAYFSAGPAVPGIGGGFTSVYDLLRRFYKSQDVTGQLTVPEEITCGVTLTPVRWLSLTGDLQWTRWSEFGDWTFRSVNADGELTPDFPQSYRDFYGLTPDYGVQGVPFVLEDAKKIKAAVECRPFTHVAVRLGFARHESAAAAADRTPVYPDLDRTVYSLGFGYEGPVFSIWRTSERIADLSFDAFARYATASPQGSDYPGFEMSYSSKRFTWGVGVGFSY